MTTARLARLGIAVTVLAGSALLAGAGLGRVPPLGAFLDPLRGVWASAAGAELPPRWTATIPGLVSAVEVLYDDRGVPHIFASNELDATRALGYVVARDRLFQLELQTRVTAGTLSEILGEDALPLDRRYRSLALARAAERLFRDLDSSALARQGAGAYTDGVNAWVDGLNPTQVPLEYRLLGATPQRWRPQFGGYIAKQLGYTLAYSDEERRRRRVAALVGETAADALFPSHSPIQLPIRPTDRASARFDRTPLPPPGDPLPAELVAGAVERLGPPALSVGSNNWAVSPSRSASGYALLAGDPHLQLTLPSTWYEVHMVVPGRLDVYGVTVPGTPGVIIGFNRDVAWSFTNSGADVLDWYEEEVDDLAHPTRYRLDQEWRPVESYVEVYRNAAGDVIAVDTLYATHRGPLWVEEGRALSMRWTVLEASQEVPAMSGALRAHDVHEWLLALEPYQAPIQNGLVADREGNIAFRATGRFPRRPGDGRGDIIRDGTTTESDWIGYRPLGQYPYALNPAGGYLASANQQPVDPVVDGRYLAAGWPSPWRAMRINRLLAQDSLVTLDAMKRYQTDPGNERAEIFVPAFLAAADRAIATGTSDSILRAAAALLRQWDRRYTKENERALLFEHAMTTLRQHTWDELDLDSVPPGRPRRVATPSDAVLAVLLGQEHGVWWDRRATPELEGREAMLNASLKAGLERAMAQAGHPDRGGWRWDRNRHANIYHLLRLKAFSALDLPVQGGRGNLNPSAGSGEHGASWRMVVELGPEVSAWGIYPGGQSGHPLSSRYRDRIAGWVAGKLDCLYFPRDRDSFDEERVASRLLLRPERPAPQTGRGPA